MSVKMKTKYHVEVSGSYTDWNGNVKNLVKEINSATDCYGNAAEFVCAWEETQPNLTFKIVENY